MSSSKQMNKLVPQVLLKFFYCYPESYFNTSIKLFFALEESYWYCLDFYNIEITFESYVRHFGSYFLIPHVDFCAYKLRIPVYGGIITNPELTHILLVRGYNKLSKYIFPKGKLDYDESARDCCIREISEEIGFDPTDHMTGEFVKPPMERYTLYWIPNVPMTTVFKTTTRNEISCIEWVSFKTILEGKPYKNKFSQVQRVLKKIWWFIEGKRKYAMNLDYNAILSPFD